MPASEADRTALELEAECGQPPFPPPTGELGKNVEVGPLPDRYRPILEEP